MFYVRIELQLYLLCVFFGILMETEGSTWCWNKNRNTDAL